MTCARHADADIAERYVLGQMDEAEQASFEEHFFGCEDCFASVQTLQQLQAALRTSPASAPEVRSRGPAASGDAGSTRGPVFIAIDAKWWGLALAASLLLGVMWWQQRRGPSPATEGGPVAQQTEPAAPPSRPPSTPPATATPGTPGSGTATPGTTPGTPGTPGTTPGATPGTAPPGSGTTTTPPDPAATPSSKPPREEPGTAPVRSPRDLAQLAVVVPPPYVPLRTRGAGDANAEAFAAAMARYSAKDYRAAADALRTLAETQPDAAHVQFFLGISLLMTDRPAEARQALERVVAAGSSPFADEAHFYLAKAAIRERDLDRAVRELKIAVEREAGPPGEAFRLLRALSDARR